MRLLEPGRRAPHEIGAEPITSRALLGVIFEELGVEPTIRVANGMLLTVLAIFSGQMRSLKREQVYQFVTPWLVDHSKYERAFGVAVTPHLEAVRTTVPRHKDHPPA